MLNKRFILNAKDISKAVSGPGGELTILKPTSLAVAQGDSLAIVGPSGSGKTTLLGLLAGLDQPSAGSVELLDNNLGAMSEDERAVLRGQGVGFVFQSFHLLDSLTAEENVMLPLELAGAASVVSQARDILTRVGLGDRLDHYPNQLSGGEKQRVAIARAYAGEPQILFADEPTGNLDSATGQEIINLLFDLNQQAGTALVLVTHEQRLADRCARVIRLEAGQIQSESQPRLVAES
ncbi:MAG: ATP-binding cassette domain-containing protein [Pseudomonadota bacterium]